MLAELIAQSLNKNLNEEQRSQDYSKFRVSDAGRCHLMRYWKRQGKPFSDVPDERTLRIFEVGRVFHIWLQNLLRLKKVLVAEEFEVQDKHRIGHVDAVVMTEQGLVLYDFKTVHSKKFHYMKKFETDGDRHYAMQAYTYAMMLPFGVTDIRIAYISKDDLCIREVSINEEYPNIDEWVLKDWVKLIECWDSQTEPEPNPMDWECGYCGYKSSCEFGQKQ